MPKKRHKPEEIVAKLRQVGRVDFLACNSIFSDIGLLRADSMSYVWGAGQGLTEPRVRGVIGGAVGEGLGDGWLLGSGTRTNHVSLGLYRIRVSAFVQYDGLTGQSLGVTFEKVATFSAAVSFLDGARLEMCVLTTFSLGGAGRVMSSACECGAS